MKALFLYNPVSGHHLKEKQVDYIVKELSECYDSLDVVASLSVEHFKEMVESATEQYDVLIVAGGDGSVNMTINIVAKRKIRPILGFIPVGTINDAVKNFGNPRNYKKTVQMIKENNVKNIDIMKINDMYASYVITAGAYSDLPYVVSNKEKAIFGRFAYYFHAIPRLFKRIRLLGNIKIDNENYDVKTPFILLLNGKRMGGFRLNKYASIDDGEIDVIYSKMRLFNSLPNYFFFKKKLFHKTAKGINVDFGDSVQWEVDGEKGPIGKIEVEVLPNYLAIFAK